MKKSLVILFGISVAAMALTACTHNNARSLPPGQYEHRTSATDSYGTENREHSTTNVYYDKFGHKQITTDKETTRDPKGLFNKTKTETHSNTK